MENILLAIVAILIGWNIIAIRKDISIRAITTTLFLSIDSNEVDENGIPLESVQLLKKTKISFAIVPGMELIETGENRPLKVTRVVFEGFQNNVRGVYLQSKRLQLSQFESMTNSYIKYGWQNRG